MVSCICSPDEILGFACFYKVLLLFSRYPCPRHRGVRVLRRAPPGRSAAHMGKRWFYQGFLQVSLIFLLPGPGGAGRAKGDMRFVVHLKMSGLLVFTRCYNCFRRTRVLIPPRLRWRPGAPFVILRGFTRFLHAFPPCPSTCMGKSLAKVWQN